MPHDVYRMLERLAFEGHHMRVADPSPILVACRTVLFDSWRRSVCLSP